MNLGDTCRLLVDTVLSPEERELYQRNRQRQQDSRVRRLSQMRWGQRMIAEEGDGLGKISFGPRETLPAPKVSLTPPESQ